MNAAQPPADLSKLDLGLPNLPEPNLYIAHLLAITQALTWVGDHWLRFSQLIPESVEDGIEEMNIAKDFDSLRFRIYRYIQQLQQPGVDLSTYAYRLALRRTERNFPSPDELNVIVPLVQKAESSKKSRRRPQQ